MVTLVFILLPSSIILYLHFYSNILPGPTPLMKLQFQYMESSGPFAFYNLTTSALDQIKPWRNTNKNVFTSVEQVLTIHLKYIKLTPGSRIGGLRLSVYDNFQQPVFYRSGTQNSSNRGKIENEWPFQPISISDNHDEFTLYRSDRSFGSWNDVIGKSYSKSIPFMSSRITGSERLENNPHIGLLDYIAPKWILNVFVPAGIQKMLSISNICSMLGRSENLDSHILDLSKNNEILQTLDLLDSFGSFKDLKAMTFSTGFLVFERELKYQDLVNTSLLVELNMNDIFIVDSFVKFDYVLRGIRWWVYWWPGLCFIVGVLLIWIICSVSCIFVSWGGFTIWSAYKMITKTQDEKNTVIVNKNLEDLLHETN